MSYETINPATAKERLDAGSDWTYLDVRTVEEFTEGHVPDAYNVPAFLRSGTGQMMVNTEFLDVVKRHFQADAKLVVGCAAGGRSAKACEMLAGEGFTQLVNMHGGFHGARDMAGNVTEAGWQACGFPVTAEPQNDRVYQTLRSDGQGA